MSAILATAGGPVSRADDKPSSQSPGPDRSSAKETPASPDEPAGSAIDAAKDYTQRMKSDQPGSAVRTYWDVDAMLTGIFGERLRRHGDAEQAEMKRLLLDFVEGVYATPAIAAAMKQAVFEDFKEQGDPSAGTKVVAFNVRLQDKVVPNSLHMKQTDGRWKVFDASTGNRMLVSAVRSQYEPQAERVTPLDYVKAIVRNVPDGKEKQRGNSGSLPARNDRTPRQ
jgi:hypothetical protein